jgi:hypothetical protein
MIPIHLDEEAVFQVARKLEVGEARSGCPDESCCGDRGPRERLEAVLHVH